MSRIRLWLRYAVMASLLALPFTAGLAQEKPWLQPGNAAGDEITGPDGTTMVWVSQGEFVMGMQPTDMLPITAQTRMPPTPKELGECPGHRVRITKGFWLGKWPVTNMQYWQYCQATRQTFPITSNQGANHPVVGVTWPQAVYYCQYHGLTLPTEAEWEYAARGPEGRIYPWGNDWDPQKCCNFYNRGPGGKSFPVGSFPLGASWCGALDMQGNVEQWCLDWYLPGFYGVSPVDDPGGPAEGSFTIQMKIGDKVVHESVPCKVVRGGDWNYTNLQWTAIRGRKPWDSVTTGFRCVARPAAE